MNETRTSANKKHNLYFGFFLLYLKVCDAAIALFLLILTSSIFAFLYFLPRKRTIPLRRILFIQTAYSYRAIIENGQTESILLRSLNGFFEKVYTLYPILGANAFDSGIRFNEPLRFIDFGQGHIFIEGKVNVFAWLKAFPAANLVWSQCYLIFAARKYVIKERIAIMHGNDPFFTGLIAFILSKLTGTLFAMRIGANYDLLYKNGHVTFKKLFKSYFVERKIARFLFPRCDLVLAANQDYLNYVLANGASKEKTLITRFGNIIDPLHFTEPDHRQKVIQEYPFAGKRFCVYVGRLSRIKHTEDLIYMMSEICKQYPDMLLVLIGKGEIEEELKKLSIELGIQKNVLFLGAIKQQHLAGFLPAAAVYVAGHSGRSLAEAALAGLPMVVYDYEWHPELVKPGITGELAPFGDWKKLAQGVCSILSDKQYAIRLGTNARKLGMELLNQEKIVEQEKASYTRLLDNHFKS